MMSSCVSCFYLDQQLEMERMLKMLHYFHPEITEEIMSKDDLERNHVHPWYYASVGRLLYNKYDTITHIDADVFIVDKLDELFDPSSDVRAGRCNSDNRMAGLNMAFATPQVPWNKHLNSGIHSISNKTFWDDWYNACIDHGHKALLWENGTFNEVFYSGKYNSIMLDPVDSNIHYGSSSAWGTKTHWDSWKNIIINNGRLFLNGKLIKMLHIAGGGPKPLPEELFTKDVSEFIYSIIEG